MEPNERSPRQADSTELLEMLHFYKPLFMKLHDTEGPIK